MPFVATGFWPARFSTHVPAVRAFNQAANPTYIKGDPVVVTAGLMDECGANPVLIAGIALQAASTAPGYAAANNPSPITGQFTGGSIALAVPTTEFVGRLVNGNDTTVAPVVGDIGAQYGITDATSGWAVDQAKVAGDARVVVTAIDTLQNVVYFRILAAYQQFQA